MRNLPKAERKIHVLLLQEWLKMAAPGIFILMLLLMIFTAMIGVSVWRLNRQDNDLKETTLFTGTALVVERTPIYTKTGMDVKWLFRINGRIADNSLLNGIDAYQDERLIWTKVGDTVPVTYRIGKSGVIYIENWQAPPHKVSMSR